VSRLVTIHLLHRSLAHGRGAPVYDPPVDFNDTPELADFRAAARRWLTNNVAPRTVNAGLRFFAEHPDEEAWLAKARADQALLFDGGWAGISWPTRYGGRELGPVHQIVFNEEAAGFDLDTDAFSIGIGMGGPTVMAWASEAQKEAWLPAMLRGDEIWCQLFSEPGAGSDVAGLTTRAVRDGDEWVINGQKVWTSGAHYSKWGMLLARTDPTVTKHQGLSYFVIDMDQPGVESRPLRQMTGGSNFNEVFFTDARVPHAATLGGEGMGWSVAMTTLMNERMSIGALGSLNRGSVFSALEQLFEEVAAMTGRRPTDDPVFADEWTATFIDAEVLRYTAQRMVSRLVRGEIPSAEGSAAKIALSRLAERLCNLAMAGQGAHGLLGQRSAPSDGDWALAFLGFPGLKVAGGTDEVMKNIIGERLLGLPREPRVDTTLPFADLPG